MIDTTLPFPYQSDQQLANWQESQSMEDSITPGTKVKTTLNLSHNEIKRLLDAVQSVHEPLELGPWPDADRRAHCKLIHRLQRADRRFALYES